MPSRERGSVPGSRLGKGSGTREGGYGDMVGIRFVIWSYSAKVEGAHRRDGIDMMEEDR